MSFEEQQVGLVVTVNYDKLREFYEAWQRENERAKTQNKGTFRELSEEAGKFVKNAVGGALLTAGADLARAITQPINTTFTSATNAAEKFRAENTRIAVAAGQDWGALGDRLKQLSKDTGRNQDEIKAYATGVEAVTKRWDTAFDSVEAYSKLAHKTGRDLASFGGLAGTMENLFKMKGSKETEAFLDRLTSKARALGLETNQAVSMFERLAPTLGRSGVSADKAGEFSNAMLKAGASPEQAQEMGSFWSGYFKQGTRWVEREMRSAGVLGKKERITDEWGRLNRDPLELIDMYHRTQKQIRRGMSDDSFREISIDNLGNEPGSMFANWPKIKAQIEVQRKAEEKRVLDETFRAYLGTSKGQADMKDRQKEAADLGMGEDILAIQDRARGYGGYTGLALNTAVKGAGGASAMAAARYGLRYLTGGAAKVAQVAASTGAGGIAGAAERAALDAAFSGLGAQAARGVVVPGARAAGSLLRAAGSGPAMVAGMMLDPSQLGYGGTRGIGGEDVQSDADWLRKQGIPVDEKKLASEIADKLATKTLRVQMYYGPELPPPPGGPRQ